MYVYICVERECVCDERPNRYAIKASGWTVFGIWPDTEHGPPGCFYGIPVRSFITHTLSLYTYIHIHTGKTYEYRVPDDEAQAWLDALIFTVKEAKAKTSRSIFREKYGHSAYSMMRAREADQEEGGGRRLY